MTEKLYLDDSYIKETEAEVVSVDGNAVRFSKTVFYPTGGGQPSDTGIAVYGNSRYRITDVIKNGDEIDHILENAPEFSPGDHVKLLLDWDRRYAHMRFHTAIHIIDAVVHNMDRPDIIITGSQISDDHARVDFDFEKLDQESAGSIIEAANRITSGQSPVNIKHMTRDEALSIPDLARTEPGRKLIESLDQVRIIEIEGVDLQADGGTHVAGTSEVGHIVLNRIKSKGRRNKRMEISLE